MQANRSPVGALAIGRVQREAIYEEVLNHLNSIGDIPGLIERGDYGTAQRLRREIERDLRLLDDLGWAEQDPGESFELTMASDELARTLERLHRDACGGVCEHVLRDKTEEQVTERHARAARACAAVLAAIARQNASEQEV
jgi:hypothetical protein